MSLSSIIDDLVGGYAPTQKTHDSDSVKQLFTSNGVDPFKKHTAKLGDRALFDETAEQFTGGKVGTGKLKNLNSILTDIKDDKEMKSIVEDVYEITGGPTKQEIRADAKKVKKLADNADTLFKGIQKEAAGHSEALDVLKKDLTDANKQINEAFAKAKETLRNAKGSNVNVAGFNFDISTAEKRAEALKIVSDNQVTTLNHLKDEFKTRVEVHELAISEMKDLAKEIEEVSGVKNKYGFAKPASALGQEAGALEKGASNAAKELEGAAKGAGMGATVGITAATTAIGGVIGHQFDKEGSQSMTIAGGAIGAVGGFLARNKIANLMSAAAHVRG